MISPGRLRWCCFLASTVATFVVIDTRAAGAQSSCAPSARGASGPVSEDEWSGVLARRVSLHGRDISLREALDRLAATARIRLSYTAELLPLTRAVCVAYESATVGSVLRDLLADTELQPVLAGSDQVVLAPIPRSASPVAAPAVAMFRQVGVLDRVVVTGSTAGGSQRSLPYAVDVISGSQLTQRGAGSLSAVLDGSVPGMWLWEQSPLSLLARYGSIRGASSFGVSYPKVYVDGIEVANSLLVTRLDPEAVSRVEIIRGPQGAALYGADAISGVINIVTRQEGTEGGAPRTQLSTAGGASSSEFSAGSVLAQNHSLSLRAGNGVRSARFALGLTTIGAFIPDAFSRQVASNGGVRLVGARSVVTGSYRFFAQDARTPSSPLLASFTPTTSATQALLTESLRMHGRSYRFSIDSGAAIPTVGDSSDRQSVRQYTLGANATFRSDDRWTQSVVAGFDGYSLKSGTVLDGAFPSATDSALRAARGSAIRGTFRAATVGQFGDSQHTAATVTLAAEYSVMRDKTETDAPFALYRPDDRGQGGAGSGSGGGGPGGPGGGGGAGGYASSIVDTRSNTGLIAQSNASYRDVAFLNAGVRLERNTGLTGIGEYEMLPMIGTAFVRPLGFATLKLRSAYGKGVRPPQTSSRAGMLMGLNRSPASAPLSAEKQSGVEEGADLFIGRALVFHLTRFDQRASGLIQPVSVSLPTATDTMHRRRIAYELQNVGEITNRGWEFEGTTTFGSLSLGGTFSSVDSRVEKLASGYSGDLKPGDRMLEVPARTMGLNAAITEKRWFASWTLVRASDWVNYDRIALAAAFQNRAHPLYEFYGSQLRTYWRKYDGVTRLGANFGYTVGRGLSFTLRGENLLDKQLGEPDNVTILPGRTVTGGLRVSF